ncbi:MAG: hypothetical protein KA205_07750 [Acidobacteria bacterium]|nr:hypothetical protein [Acidobacteriota bacterium]
MHRLLLALIALIAAVPSPTILKVEAAVMQLGGVGGSPSMATSVAERQAAWAAHQQLAASSPFARLPWRALGPTQQSSRIEAIARCESL